MLNNMSQNFLRILLTKISLCIQSLLTPNDKVPLFNGSIEENLEDFKKFTDLLEYKKEKIRNLLVELV